MAHYGQSNYWEERYTRDPQPFDWYQRFSSLRKLIVEKIPKDSTILNVGAGNSRLSEEMYDEGFQHIINIDLSHVVIKSMQEKYKELGENFKYLQMDVRKMEFENDSFGCVIDKGTFDCVMCTDSPEVNISAMIQEIYRVLQGKGGIYVLISYGSPDTRLEHLKKEKFDWDIEIIEIKRPSISVKISLSQPEEAQQNHYFYICKQKQQGNLNTQYLQRKYFPFPFSDEPTSSKKLLIFPRIYNLLCLLQNQRNNINFSQQNQNFFTCRDKDIFIMELESDEPVLNKVLKPEDEQNPIMITNFIWYKNCKIEIEEQKNLVDEKSKSSQFGCCRRRQSKINSDSAPKSSTEILVLHNDLVGLIFQNTLFIYNLNLSGTSQKQSHSQQELQQEGIVEQDRLLDLQFQKDQNISVYQALDFLEPIELVSLSEDQQYLLTFSGQLLTGFYFDESSKRYNRTIPYQCQNQIIHIAFIQQNYFCLVTKMNVIAILHISNDQHEQKTDILTTQMLLPTSASEPTLTQESDLLFYNRYSKSIVYLIYQSAPEISKKPNQSNQNTPTSNSWLYLQFWPSRDFDSFIQQSSEGSANSQKFLEIPIAAQLTLQTATILNEDYVQFQATVNQNANFINLICKWSENNSKIQFINSCDDSLFQISSNQQQEQPVLKSNFLLSIKLILNLDGEDELKTKSPEIVPRKSSASITDRILIDASIFDLSNVSSGQQQVKLDKVSSSQKLKFESIQIKLRDQQMVVANLLPTKSGSSEFFLILSNPHDEQSKQSSQNFSCFQIELLDPQEKMKYLMMMVENEQNPEKIKEFKAETENLISYFKLNSELSTMLKWENSTQKSDAQIYSLLFQINDIEYIENQIFVLMNENKLTLQTMIAFLNVKEDHLFQKLKAQFNPSSKESKFQKIIQKIFRNDLLNIQLKLLKDCNEDFFFILKRNLFDKIVESNILDFLTNNFGYINETSEEIQIQFQFSHVYKAFRVEIIESFFQLLTHISLQYSQINYDQIYLEFLKQINNALCSEKGKNEIMNKSEIQPVLEEFQWGGDDVAFQEPSIPNQEVKQENQGVEQIGGAKYENILDKLIKMKNYPLFQHQIEMLKETQLYQNLKHKQLFISDGPSNFSNKLKDLLELVRDQGKFVNLIGTIALQQYDDRHLCQLILDELAIKKGIHHKEVNERFLNLKIFNFLQEGIDKSLMNFEDIANSDYQEKFQILVSSDISNFTIERLETIHDLFKRFSDSNFSVLFQNYIDSEECSVLAFSKLIGSLSDHPDSILVYLFEDDMILKSIDSKVLEIELQDFQAFSNFLSLKDTYPQIFQSPFFTKKIADLAEILSILGLSQQNFGFLQKFFDVKTENFQEIQLEGLIVVKDIIDNYLSNTFFKSKISIEKDQSISLNSPKNVFKVLQMIHNNLFYKQQQNYSIIKEHQILIQFIKKILEDDHFKDVFYKTEELIQENQHLIPPEVLESTVIEIIQIKVEQAQSIRDIYEKLVNQYFKFFSQGGIQGRRCKSLIKCSLLLETLGFQQTSLELEAISDPVLLIHELHDHIYQLNKEVIEQIPFIQIFQHMSKLKHPDTDYQNTKFLSDGFLEFLVKLSHSCIEIQCLEKVQQIIEKLQEYQSPLACDVIHLLITSPQYSEKREFAENYKKFLRIGLNECRNSDLIPQFINIYSSQRLYLEQLEGESKEPQKKILSMGQNFLQSLTGQKDQEPKKMSFDGIQSCKNLQLFDTSTGLNSDLLKEFMVRIKKSFADRISDYESNYKMFVPLLTIDPSRAFYLLASKISLIFTTNHVSMWDEEIRKLINEGFFDKYQLTEFFLKTIIFVGLMELKKIQGTQISNEDSFCLTTDFFGNSFKIPRDQMKRIKDLIYKNLDRQFSGLYQKYCDCLVIIQYYPTFQNRVQENDLDKFLFNSTFRNQIIAEWIKDSDDLTFFQEEPEIFKMEDFSTQELIYSNLLKDLKKNTDQGNSDALNNLFKYKSTVKNQVNCLFLMEQFLAKIYEKIGSFWNFFKFIYDYVIPAEEEFFAEIFNIPTIIAIQEFRTFEIDLPLEQILDYFILLNQQNIKYDLSSHELSYTDQIQLLDQEFKDALEPENVFLIANFLKQIIGREAADQVYFNFLKKNMQLGLEFMTNIQNEEENQFNLEMVYLSIQVAMQRATPEFLKTKVFQFIEKENITTFQSSYIVRQALFFFCEVCESSDVLRYDNKYMMAVEYLQMAQLLMKEKSFESTTIEVRLFNFYKDLDLNMMLNQKLLQDIKEFKYLQTNFFKLLQSMIEQKFDSKKQKNTRSSQKDDLNLPNLNQILNLEEWYSCLSDEVDTEFMIEIIQQISNLQIEEKTQKEISKILLKAIFPQLAEPTAKEIFFHLVQDLLGSAVDPPSLKICLAQSQIQKFVMYTDYLEGISCFQIEHNVKNQLYGLIANGFYDGIQFYISKLSSLTNQMLKPHQNERNNHHQTPIVYFYFRRALLKLNEIDPETKADAQKITIEKDFLESCYRFYGQMNFIFIMSTNQDDLGLNFASISSNDEKFQIALKVIWAVQTLNNSDDQKLISNTNEAKHALLDFINNSIQEYESEGSLSQMPQLIRYFILNYFNLEFFQNNNKLIDILFNDLIAISKSIQQPSDTQFSVLFSIQLDCLLEIDDQYEQIIQDIDMTIKQRMLQLILLKKFYQAAQLNYSVQNKSYRDISIENMVKDLSQTLLELQDQKQQFDQQFLFQLEESVHELLNLQMQ